MQQVGTINRKVISALSLPIQPGTPIFLGDSNVIHMKNRHPEDYKKYGVDIPEILSNPDYVGLNKKDGSFEYVKEYKINNEFVKVAVRISGSGKYFARSLYILNKNRVNNFIEKGNLKKL